jgi:threonine aldolase
MSRFMSDTGAPAHPQVLRALDDVNTGAMASYGGDAISEHVAALVESLMGEPCAIALVASGTAANGLALSLMTSPLGGVVCHSEAHIERDERGAVEFFTGGARLQCLNGPGGKLSPDDLSAHLGAQDRSFVHATPAEVVSLTNLTESGCAYAPDEIAALVGVAHAHACLVHLDGARLANALVSTRTSLATMISETGVDVAVLGLTKTGAMGCEVILLRDEMAERAAELKARLKRAGHLPPKQRFIAAQAEALLADGLWLSLAEAANGRALELAAIFRKAEIGLIHDVDGNEVFADVPPNWDNALIAAGVNGYRWTDGSMRFVTHWATTRDDINALERCLSALRHRGN